MIPIFDKGYDLASGYRNCKNGDILKGEFKNGIFEGYGIKYFFVGNKFKIIPKPFL